MLKFLQKEEEVMISDPITLDEEQEKAVHTLDDHVLVVAGAGSGKTRVLTERIKYLINSGVKPSNIVAITFTNMASEEMKLRLKSVPKIGDCFVGTIHSFANRIMKLNSEDNYRIFDTEISNSFHRELIEKYCKFLTNDRYLKYLDLKSASELGQIPEEMVTNFFTPSEHAELCFIEGNSAPNNTELDPNNYPESIKDLCRKYNVIDFNDLLEMAIKFFQENDSEIEHLLIDEFQDIGTLEYKFFKALNAKNNFYVGDDWQSIYGFKGGNVNIMLSLINNKDYQIYRITNNYRSAQAIVDFSKDIIEQVPHRILKDITVLRNDYEGEVYINNRGNAEYVIKTLLEDEENLKDWFILTRSNRDLYELDDLLSSMKIRHSVIRREGLSLNDLNNLMDFNSVKLMTVHTSKGLEAPNVILYGNFPVNTPRYRNNPEERKVMYVGITRAKDNLVLLN